MTDVPSNHHLDKRAHAIAQAIVREFEGAESEESADSAAPVRTRVAAKLLGMSTHWLEQGRVKGYGPKFIRVGSRGIRYRPQDLIDYLNAREHQRTSEYIKRPSDAAAQSASPAPLDA